MVTVGSGVLGSWGRLRKIFLWVRGLLVVNTVCVPTGRGTVLGGVLWGEFGTIRYSGSLLRGLRKGKGS